MNTHIEALPPALRTSTRTALRALVAAVTIALVTFGLTAVGAPAQAAQARSTAIMSMSSGTYESKVQYFVNVKRAKHGLNKLRLDSCADGTAERWAKYLANADEFFHQSMGNILDTCGAYYAGETLGRGTISPHRLVYLWMHSPAHRHVLLSKYAKRIGVGAYVDSHGQWLTAANFTRY
jgi:uncharacterized protein YkwD